MRMTTSFRASKRTPLLQVAKSAIATVAAWFVAGWLIPGPIPVFAAIAALLVVQPSVNQSYLRGIERSAGVVAGVIVAGIVGVIVPEMSVALPLAVAATLLIAWASRMSPGTTNQAGISALLVIALGSTTPLYAVDRVVETLLGALVGFVVNIALVPPVAIAPAREAAERLGEELARSLERLADAFGSRPPAAERTSLLIQARLLRTMQQAAETAITEAGESLTLNPRAARHRDALASLRALVALFSPVIQQTIGMTRAFADHYDDDLAAEPAVAHLAEQLRRAAHDVRLKTRRSASPVSTHTQTLPALTAPLMLGRPSDAHWVLIGSVLEDLRRVHHELTHDENGRSPRRSPA